MSHAFLKWHWMVLQQDCEQVMSCGGDAEAVPLVSDPESTCGILHCGTMSYLKACELNLMSF